jgi:hypothetical protein
MNVWVSTSIIKARGIIAQSRVELLPQGDFGSSDLEVSNLVNDMWDHNYLDSSASATTLFSPKQPSDRVFELHQPHRMDQEVCYLS